MSSANVEPVSGDTYFGRVGTFVLAVGKDPTADLKKLYEDVAKSLREDNRVNTLFAPKLYEHWIDVGTVYPATASNPQDLLLGVDSLRGVQFPQPYVMELTVPIKNQPRIHGEKAASEHYLVAWDGWTAVVLWQEGETEYVPASAGQILIEVLTDAAHRLGLDLYVQACSPGCELKFAHRGMRVTARTGETTTVEFRDDGTDAVEVEVETEASNKVPIAALVHRELVLPARRFSEVKSIARRILNIEAAARKMTSELIALDYMRVSDKQAPIRKRIGNWWHNVRFHRGQRGPRRAKYLIASLWLAMASIEVLQRGLAEAHREFDDAISDWAVPGLFEGDLKSDEADARSVNAQFVRAAVEHKSSKIDTRVLVTSTLVAGVIGGVLGLVGALATLMTHAA